MLTDIHYKAEHVLLTLQRTNGINLIECILLKDDKVDNFGFPERLVIINRHTVIAEDVDLLLNLLTALQIGLHIIYHWKPIFVDEFGDIRLKLRIFHIFGVRINRVNSRVTFSIGASLLQGIETTRYFLRTFGYRLFEVTSGRRNGTKEGN